MSFFYFRSQEIFFYLGFYFHNTRIFSFHQKLLSINEALSMPFLFLNAFFIENTYTLHYIVAIRFCSSSALPPYIGLNPIEKKSSVD